jgi:hypothetical protein
MASLNYGGRDSVVLDYVRNGSLGGYTAQLPSRSYGGWRGACRHYRGRWLVDHCFGGLLAYAARSDGCWPCSSDCDLVSLSMSH